MIRFLFAILLCVLSAGVVEAQAPSAEVRKKIAAKIWQNECAGTVKGLVSWNKGEEFPSLGIGHFIWYPAGVKGKFEESFPSLVVFAESKGIKVPGIAKGKAPWSDRNVFAGADVKGGTADQLRRWLAATTEVQADFIIARSMAALKRMEAASRQPDVVRARYMAVASSPQGMYALIDYVNFKGEGVNASERYNGEGWGLLQVLEDMAPVGKGTQAAGEFSKAAKRVLQRRIANSPKSRGEARWSAGWMNRCDTYAKPL